jgi:1-acyl-sn-glycerol-3-phosphate acyltransferase
MAVALRVFYKHIHVHGLQHIPAKGPVILIANHTSSLMDAALLGVLLKRPIHFFARADVFTNVFVKKILHGLNMAPVYQNNKYRNNLQVNDDTFNHAKKILNNGEVILFFPEGSSHVEYELLPFKKGIFRLGFDFMQQTNWRHKLPVIPIGLNYDHPTAAFKNVSVNIGKGFLLNEYKQAYFFNQSAALLSISKEAYYQLSPLVLQLNKDKQQWGYDIITAERKTHNEQQAAWCIQSNKKFLKEKALCDNINQMPAYNAIPASKNNMLHWGNILFLIVASPFYLLGDLLNGLPILIARRIATVKVYRLDFYSWIFVAVAALLYIAWLVVLFIGFAVAINMSTGLLIFLITILSGWFTVRYKKCKQFTVL